MQMTNDERIAYEWAIKQQFQSVAARYARTLAKYIKRSGLTPVVGDAASPPDSGEQTRTSGQAGEGSAPHPPRA